MQHTRLLTTEYLGLCNQIKRIFGFSFFLSLSLSPSLNFSLFSVSPLLSFSLCPSLSLSLSLCLSLSLSLSLSLRRGGSHNVHGEDQAGQEDGERHPERGAAGRTDQ